MLQVLASTIKDAIPKRYFTAILSLFCLMLLFLLQNMQQKVEKFFPDCSFKMNHKITFAILAAFSLPGGIATTRFGGALIFGSAIGFSAILSMLTQLTLNIGDPCYSILRYIDVLNPVLAYCALLDVWSRWASPQERSTLVTFSFSGTYFALVLHYKLDDLIPEFIEPKYQFYLIGLITLFLSLIWLYVTQNDPTLDRTLTLEEKRYSNERIDILDRDRHILRSYPWKSILTSKPLWSLCIVEFVRLMIANKIFPTRPAIFSLIAEKFSEPILIWAFLLYFLILGYAADHTRITVHYSSMQIRKLYILVGLFTGAVAVWYFEKIPENLFFALPSQALIQIAVWLNLIDLSPRYSGLLYGFLSSFNSLASLILQFDYLKKEDEDKNSSTILTIATYVVGAAMYYLWGSANLQSWNDTLKDEHELRKRGIDRNKCSSIDDSF